jgi:hypothetical protein
VNEIPFVTEPKRAILNFEIKTQSLKSEKTKVVFKTSTTMVVHNKVKRRDP